MSPLFRLQTKFLPVRELFLCHDCKIMYSMGQGCHPARRVHKQAIGFMHSVSHHNEVVCSIQGIRVLAMIRIIAAIADVTPAPLIDATHIFSKPVHDFILFQGIMKTVFFFLKTPSHHAEDAISFTTASVSTGSPKIQFLTIVPVSDQTFTPPVINPSFIIFF